ncbi:hypothetical protein ACQEU3_23370 [Spirillospora sp. CA-253888]
MIPSRVVPVCLALLALSAGVDAWLLFRLDDLAGELRVLGWRADRLGQAGIAGKLLAALVLAVLLRPLRAERPAAAARGAAIASLAGGAFAGAASAVLSGLVLVLVSMMTSMRVADEGSRPSGRSDADPFDDGTALLGLFGVTLAMAVLTVASVGALAVWAGVSRRD